jgi:hypothetical protein
MPLDRRATLAIRSALLLAAAVVLPAAVGRAAAAQPAADTRSCALLWQVTPVLGSSGSGEPPQLRLALRFQAGSRSQTTLHLPGGWAGHTELPDDQGDGQSKGPRLQALPGEPTRRSVAHAPGETVQLQWRMLPTGDASQGGHTQLASGWFAFSGQGVLPMPEGVDDSTGPACVALQGLPDMPAGSRWASSHGTAEGRSALFVLGPSAVPLAQRVQQALYAGGALQWQSAPGVLAVLPAAAPWRIQAAAVAQAGARALAAQQRQWPEPAGRGASGAAPPWLLLVLPAAAAAPQDGALASAWQQALALQLPPAWAGDEAGVERQITAALARAWTAERFGPLAHAGRGDALLRAWFSEGWADFLAHRSLLREGLWNADDYAAALNARIAAYLDEPARALPNAQLVANSALAPRLATLQALRGEWLALQWQLALRRAGQPGLDTVLRQQLVPAAQARRDGPISAPLATHRLLAALRSVLHDQPMRELQLHIDQGQPFDFRPDSLGPCFMPAAATGRGTAPAYQPVPAALQQADCQGWLGLGPLAEVAAAAPRGAAAAGCQAGARARTACVNTKATTKPAARPAAKSAGKAARPKAGQPAR